LTTTRLYFGSLSSLYKVKFPVRVLVEENSIISNGIPYEFKLRVIASLSPLAVDKTNVLILIACLQAAIVISIDMATPFNKLPKRAIFFNYI